MRGCGLVCAEVGGYGRAWFLLGPWLSRPRLSGAGAGPSQVHGWWAHYQGHCLVWLLPGPLANGTDGRVWKGGLELSPRGMGLLWVCSRGRPLTMRPQRAPACLPSAGLLGLRLHPFISSTSSCLSPKAPAKHFVRGWLPCHCFCGTGRLRPCHSTIWHLPRKWLLCQDDDVCLSSSRKLCVAHFFLVSSE